jgi:very-short-patch-repair endonuclease/uncharacterized C2H2 Zn-finger protein
MKKLSKEQFIQRANIIHNNKYNYDLVNYINSQIKIKILCPIHNEFEQRPNDHLQGKGCPYCSNNKKINTDIFIKKAILIHEGKYDYSKTIYKNSKTPVIIICKEHGEFNQIAHEHLKGSGCPKCYKSYKLNTDLFIKKANKKHNFLYEYKKTYYKFSKQEVIITCKTHGDFKQKPYAHLNGQGCPMCNKSKGENIIINFLNENNIKYEYQKSFDLCKNKRKLKFDFYLSDYNLCIEFDGVQHDNNIEYFGGIRGLKYRKNNDLIKNNYCKENNIKLIRIKYNDNIENCLKNNI